MFLKNDHCQKGTVEDGDQVIASFCEKYTFQIIVRGFSSEVQWFMAIVQCYSKVLSF